MLPLQCCLHYTSFAEDALRAWKRFQLVLPVVVQATDTKIFWYANIRSDKYIQYLRLQDMHVCFSLV